MARRLLILIAVFLLLSLSCKKGNREGIPALPAASVADFTGNPASIDNSLEKNPTVKYLEGRLLIRFKETVSWCAGENILDAWGLKILHKFDDSLRGLYIVEGDFKVAEILPVLLEDPDILYVEPDYIGEFAYQPNDTYAGAYHHGKIHSYDAWNVEAGDPSFVIAHIDSGVHISHPDLAANIWTNPGEIAGNDVDDDGNGYKDDVHGWNFSDNNDDLSDMFAISSGHGTCSASVEAGVGDNGQGVCGVAYRCKIMVLKFDGNFTGVIPAMEYARKAGVKLINLSWTMSATSSALADAMAALETAGILVVVSAGNYGSNIDSSPVYPPCLPRNNMLTVLSTTQSDQLYSTSSYGSAKVHLGAPGGDIRVCTKTGGYTTISGTSFASPMVTGAAALLWSMDSGLSYGQVKQAIMDTVTPVSSISGKCVTGGILNVSAAVDEIGGSPPTQLKITTDSLPYALIDLPYGNSVQVEGAVNPCTYSIVSGSLPPSLSMDSGTGYISGTPPAAELGLHTFTVRVDDSASKSDSKQLSIDVLSEPPLVPVQLPRKKKSGGCSISSGSSDMSSVIGLLLPYLLLILLVASIGRLKKMKKV